MSPECRGAQPFCGRATLFLPTLSFFLAANSSLWSSFLLSCVLSCSFLLSCVLYLLFMNNDRLRIQINDYDTYQYPPLALDALRDRVTQVPIIRIFGSLQLPQLCYNVLIHVHNYYPYVFLDCFEKDPELLHSSSHLDSLVGLFESKIAESFSKSPAAQTDQDHFLDGAPSKRKFIADVQVCKGNSIYGFQLGFRLYYKVSFLSPLYKTRFTKLFNDGLVYTKTKSLIYEAHLPYTLQFLTDFNLYGCDWLEVSNCYFRLPLINQNINLTQNLTSLKNFLKPWISSKNLLDPINFERIGRSLIEADILSNFILNRSLLRPQHIHNSFNTPSKTENIISSLQYVHNDILYQCNLRNFEFPNNHEFDKTFGDQSSIHENLDLLNYMIQLNGRSPTSHPNTYYDQYLKKSQLHTESFPTIFDLLDLDLNLMHSPTMNNLFDYDRLFNTQASPAPHTSPIKASKLDSLLKISFNSDFSDELQVEDIHLPVEDIHLQEEEMHLPVEENEEIEEIEQLPSRHENSFSQLDDSTILYQLTQKKKRSHSQIDSNSESFQKTKKSPSQNVIDLNFKGSLFEIPVPQSLQKDNLINSFQDLDILKINYQDPFYDNSSDLPSKPLIFSNKKITIPLNNNQSIQSNSISAQISHEARKKSKSVPTVNKTSNWLYTLEPPSKLSMKNWLSDEIKRKSKQNKFKSQIEPGITQSNNYKYSYNSGKIDRQSSSFIALTNFILEIHVNTNDNNLPNPEIDPITAIFYKFIDSNNMFENLDNPVPTLGILILSDCPNRFNKVNPFLNNDEPTKVKVFDNELQMILKLILIVELFDPDILSGYEINSSSWGYIVERFKLVYDMNLLFELSRCKFKSNGKFGDRWGFQHTSNLQINGRHMLNIWRSLKGLQLTSYSIQNVAYHLLHQTLPNFSNLNLSDWFEGNYNQVLFVLKFYQKKISLTLKILDFQEIILQNMEQSRLIGIDFNSSFYRGSQYKVESILARISKSENVLLNSPSKQQVHNMRPIECIPLILEPESNFYKSPMIVLDFQSLYPSIMIAFNYCFSTLVGKLNGFKNTKNNIGYLKHLHLDPGIVDLLHRNDGLNISPNGYVFVKSNFKKSILAKMLEEILDTRINIKLMMKFFKDDKNLIKLYNSRQLALKLIANVTYGYTSATFSGRMPNSDIADAIVSTGREILSQSIELIENANYGAKVIYGDTDSLFVYLPGKSKAESFKIGDSLARLITKEFPDPIKLKFEKVYHPCVLLAKKRYVGYSYEYEDQIEPKFDAKGIETVRRDGIPAQLKMVEKCLRILFNTKNLSQVKNYTLTQFQKILFNKVPINDFCFAKAVRLGTYKNDKYLPPGAIIATKNLMKDPRNEPQYKERIKYVVIKDSTKPRIKDRCITPEEFIESFKTKNSFTLDYDYYITRVLIPPLERIFNLIGVDLQSWYKDLPKLNNFAIKERDILNVSNFIKYNSCLNCGAQLKNFNDLNHICYDCIKNELSLMTNVSVSTKMSQFKLLLLVKSCSNCMLNNSLQVGVNNKNFEDNCNNNDCTVYFDKFKTLNTIQLEHKEKGLILDDLEW